MLFTLRKYYCASNLNDPNKLQKLFLCFLHDRWKIQCSNNIRMVNCYLNK